MRMARTPGSALYLHLLRRRDYHHGASLRALRSSEAMIRLAIIKGQLFALFSSPRPRPLPKPLPRPESLRLAVLVLMLLQSALLGGCGGTAAPEPCTAEALAGEWSQLAPIPDSACAHGQVAVASHSYFFDENGSALEMTVTTDGPQVSGLETWSITPAGELQVEGTLGACSVIPGERLFWGNTAYAWEGAQL